MVLPPSSTKVPLGQWHQSLQPIADTSPQENATNKNESSDAWRGYRIPLQQCNLAQQALVQLRRTEQIQDIKWRQQALSATSTDGSYKIVQAFMITPDILFARTRGEEEVSIYINLIWLWEQTQVDRSILQSVNPRLEGAVQSCADLSDQILRLVKEFSREHQCCTLLIHHPFLLKGGRVVIGKRFALDYC